jgi:hypothetical protein
MAGLGNLAERIKQRAHADDVGRYA